LDFSGVYELLAQTMRATGLSLVFLPGAVAGVTHAEL